MTKPAKPRSALDTSDWAPPEAYNALIRSLKLQDIRMVSATFRSERRPDTHATAIAGDIESSARFEPLDNGFVAFIHLRLDARSQKRKALAFRVEGEYALTYRTEIEITPELFRPFVHLNLPVQAWPYFREWVQAATARMQWPQLSLPSLHSTGASLDLTSGVVDVEVEDPS